jgi:hypothetical protein
MRSAFVSVVALALLPSTLAFPFKNEKRNWKQPKLCSLDHLDLKLPENQTLLAVPPNTEPVFVTVRLFNNFLFLSNLLYWQIGIGNQNYTCSEAGNYTSKGAVALLYDLSCPTKTKQISLFKRDGHQKDFHLQFHNERVFGHERDVFKLLGNNAKPIGNHYFINNPVTGEGITPVFDFRTGILKNDPNGFIANKVPPKSIPSPDGPEDINWLLLEHLKGDAAKFTFRVETTGGQPPAKCKHGQDPDISVAYTAQYCEFILLAFDFLELTCCSRVLRL